MPDLVWLNLAAKASGGGKMADIFISYAREDRSRVKHLAELLTSFGYSVWWDPEITPGKEFDDVIDKALEDAKCVIVIWSAHSVESRWVKEEAEDGLSRGILVPILLDQVTIPRGFRRLQASDLSNATMSVDDPVMVVLLRQIETLTKKAPHDATVDSAGPPRTFPWPRIDAHHFWRLKLPLFIGVTVASLAFVAFGSLLPNFLRTSMSHSIVGPKIPSTSASSPVMPKRPAAREGMSSRLSAVSTAVPVGPEHALPRAGQQFRDCEACPLMIAVPEGKFRMGSPETETGRWEDEGPAHEVLISRRFAIGLYEVTFAEWDRCVEAGACPGPVSDTEGAAADEGWGRGNRPVINVSWNDAHLYIAWLSKLSGVNYRLPSEAEWEYAARAGTASPYYTGNTIAPSQANYDSHESYHGSPTGIPLRKTVEVGSYPANPFGLYDMLGNVMEWVEDCAHDSYDGARADQLAWTAGNCNLRIERGGSWYQGPRILRSAFRAPEPMELRDRETGFRIARY